MAGNPEAVSHYLSFTRMAASGTVVVEGEEFEVTGRAWMDHEFFSDYLTEHKVGWDWMSVQLDDGVDLMLFGIRDAQGGYGPDSFGTFVDADGGVRPIEPGGVTFPPRKALAQRGDRRRVPGGMAGGRPRTSTCGWTSAPRLDAPGGLHR